MMKLVVLAAFVAVALADVSHLFNKKPPSYTPFAAFPRHNAPLPVPVPQYSKSAPVAKIISYKNEVYPDGSYEYAYDTENGISAQEQGSQKPVGNQYGTAAQGSFSFTSPEGVPVAISYIADENGFQPVGDALPTPPPVPVAIQRSVEYNLKYAQPEQKQPVAYNPFG